MDSFENIIATLLRREGYWIAPSVKVDLSKQHKRDIGRPSSPRWELDLVAYKGSTNEVLVVECKSFLHSTGVTFRKGAFEPLHRYKLFADERLRQIVLNRLVEQFTETGLVRPSPKVTLCLAAGHIASRSDLVGLHSRFNEKGWRLFDTAWVCERLKMAAASGFENDVAHVVAKLLVQAEAPRKGNRDRS